MSTVAGLRASTVHLPLRAPVRLAARTVSARSFTLVEVTDDDGATGVGFTFAGYGGSELVGAAADLLAGAVVGQDVDATARIWGAMARSSLLEGGAGVVMRALSAIDIALWDLRAARAGLPLHRLLGAQETERVPGYLAGGYFTDGGTPALLAELDEQLALGATTVKVKIGAGGPQEDVARVAAVREHVGPDVRLIADANGAWASLAQALPTARALAALGLHYLEDPFPAALACLNPRLEAAAGVLVATGETLSSPAAFQGLIQRGEASVLVVDATACGGVTGFLRVAGMAALWGQPIHTHWFPELHAPLAATLTGDVLVEAFADDRAVNFSRLVDGGPAWHDGMLELSDRPGLGVSLRDRG